MGRAGGWFVPGDFSHGGIGEESMGYGRIRTEPVALHVRVCVRAREKRRERRESVVKTVTALANSAGVVR